MSQSNLQPSTPPAPAAKLVALNDLKFDNRFVRELPGDPETRNGSRQVRDACYTRVEPTPVNAPRLLAWSDPVGEMLGIARPLSATGPEAQVLAGNRVLPGMEPYAARYGGHQFGHWAGQLGDGRAMTLGEVLGPDGIRRELQLKGAGRTPYSRTADGRAVLRSSVREFLCSEAMHYLGVPTTRALSLVATGDAVMRDMFYNGNLQAEPGAVVCRVAPSFIRFGNFEIFSAHGELELLKRLADFVIAEYFPELRLPGPAAASAAASVSPSSSPDHSVYARWFEEICGRTGTLIAHWMRVGFVHGVMNTDNMSILGLTIDYGPYGWLEGFDLHWTPNTTDAQGRRYCYGNQPGIAQWNLVRLGNALAPLINDDVELERGLAVFAETFEQAWRGMLADKLGLVSLGQEGDDALLADMFELLQQVETDMTLFFRGLMNIPLDSSFETIDSAGGEVALAGMLRRAFYDEAQAFAPQHLTRLASWLRRYVARTRLDRRDGLGAESTDARYQRMSRANPKYVLRNYLAQQAIEALERDDATVIERIMNVLRNPYDEQPEHDELAEKRPEWARHKAGCSALSCSS
ncbi:protein adenylyltransferase SelO [Nitrosospira sp. Is2]|uniref:protein adenylyltransferase SelO n=1 Tax=Nitrosospira sp. Is2 TaxID=3080532 RepID=UPI002955CE8A|nr:YdiU family protein [Nitrosospira sp. Is2]WON73806.1 YdiU family protein [Nitrosospira sp. Is2]